MNFKTFFSYMAVMATLVAWAVSANAQSALQSESSIFDGISHECMAKSDIGTSSVWVKDSWAEQTFRACSNGTIEAIYLNVLENPQTTEVGILLYDLHRNVLSSNRMELEEGMSGILKIKMPILVSEGVEYTISIRVDNTSKVKFGAVRLSEADGTFSVGGWNLAGQLEFAVSQSDRNVDEAHTGRIDIPNTQEDGAVADNPIEDAFIAFPNPFQNELNIEFTKAIEGETHIVLTDLNGNVISREVRSDVQWGERITIAPRYELLPGVYAVRILNGTNVTNYTVLKN